MKSIAQLNQELTEINQVSLTDLQIKRSTRMREFVDSDKGQEWNSKLKTNNQNNRLPIKTNDGVFRDFTKVAEFYSVSENTVTYWLLHKKHNLKVISMQEFNELCDHNKPTVSTIKRNEISIPSDKRKCIMTPYGAFESIIAATKYLKKGPNYINKQCKKDPTNFWVISQEEYDALPDA